MKNTLQAKKSWWLSRANWVIVIMALIIFFLFAANMDLSQRFHALKAQINAEHQPKAPEQESAIGANLANSDSSISPRTLGNSSNNPPATKIIFKEGDYYRRATDVAGMKDYLTKYPKGEHAAVVQQLLVVTLEAQNQGSKDAKEKTKDLAPGLDMVAIPAGNFTMGDDSGRDYGLELPAHRVYVNAFNMSKYEVTFAQYDEFLDATTDGRDKSRDAGWGRADRPAMNVSWHDAKAYANWLSEQTGKAYRLPTEAEWEYAARAMTTSAYSWGNLVGCNLAQYRDLDGAGCNTDLKRSQTAPVGSYHPNAFGLFDMHGNVYEWVEDCAHANYVDAPNDGSAWVSGACIARMLRGGSWAHFAEGARSASRYWLSPYFRSEAIGFRLVTDQ